MSSPASLAVGMSHLFAKIKITASLKSLCTIMVRNSACDACTWESSAESNT